MKYYWLNEDSRKFLERGYLKPGVTPEQRVRQIADKAEEILGIEGFADKFEDYMSRGWYSLASPIWANFGEPTGLPISCNGSYIGDSMESILYTQAEVGVMTKHGAGTSAYFGDLRPRGAPISMGGESFGAVHFIELFDCVTRVVSQSNVRRGTFAAYYPMEGKDFDEFMRIRDEGNRIQEINFGACITDQWMREMLAGDKEKKQAWASLIGKRFKSGYPYIFWTDNVNNNKPQVYKDKGLTIHASNVCTEIALSSDIDESFVCNLASLNVLHYDEWKDTDAVFTLFLFLDANLTEYIEKTTGIKFMERANRFARRQRAVGVGILGWHSFLQSKMIPFESWEAKRYNVEIIKYIDLETEKASRYLAEKFGEPELMEGYGLRNATRMAIAPTKSSSFILGQVSQSIEPLHSNYFVQELAKGRFTYKNPYLVKLFEEKGQNTPQVWKSIMIRGGSVQHLDFLSDHEKAVFKTFGEISQKEIIIQAAQRQKFIDQAQSINLRIHPDTPLPEVHQLLVFAWEQGIKTLYYHKSTNPAQELMNNLLTCEACEA